MNECCGQYSYTHKYMEKSITEHFGNNVIITEINGNPNVVTLRSNAASILQAKAARCRCRKNTHYRNSSKLNRK